MFSKSAESRRIEKIQIGRKKLDVGHVALYENSDRRTIERTGRQYYFSDLKLGDGRLLDTLMYSAAEAAYGRRLAMRCSDASNLYRMPPARRSDLLAPLDGRSAPIGRRDAGLSAGSGARSARSPAECLAGRSRSVSIDSAAAVVNGVQLAALSNTCCLRLHRFPTRRYNSWLLLQWSPCYGY